ncbi:uncharacterized protein LOC129217696 [Uloborus diversus]|uniref:uncharacterized protein LOC129217696 n=1 Tax=Uloborus diversus TaxID=327109 RepID=UPI002409CBE7|nr:uncharacterized protein LOC129217696 [Uloborus diversus]
MKYWTPSNIYKAALILIVSQVFQVYSLSLEAQLTIGVILARLLKPKFVPVPIPLPFPLKFKKHIHKPYPVPVHSLSAVAHHVGPSLHGVGYGGHPQYSSGHHAYEQLHSASNNIGHLVEQLSHSPDVLHAGHSSEIPTIHDNLDEFSSIAEIEALNANADWWK